MARTWFILKMKLIKFAQEHALIPKLNLMRLNMHMFFAENSITNILILLDHLYKRWSMSAR